MSKRPTLMVLGAGRLQIPAIVAATKRGMRVVAVDGNSAAPGLRLADTFRVADITDPSACLAIAREEDVRGVVHICSEAALYSQAVITRALSLPGISYETARRATNKALMREAFQKAGVPSPRFREVSSLADLQGALADLERPTMVKPSRSSGSRGITRIETSDTSDVVRAAWQRAIENSRDPSVVVEEYVGGPEYSVEVLAFAGRVHVLAVTDKITSGHPNYVELGHSEPASLSPSAFLAVERATAQAVNALGIDWAAAHVELRLSSSGPVVIEVGPRMGGDYITTELVPRSTGIDMVGAVVELAIGQMPVLERATEQRGAAIRYLAPPPGLVVSVRGVDAARRAPGVVEVHVDATPGSMVMAVTSSLARAGHVIAEGRSAEEAIELAEKARRLIQIGVEEC